MARNGTLFGRIALTLIKLRSGIKQTWYKEDSSIRRIVVLGTD